METLLALLGAISFTWLVFFSFFIFLFILLTEKEQIELSSLVLTIGLVVYCVYYSVNPIHLIIDNAVSILLYGFLYLATGVLWSFFKFDRFCAEMSKNSSKNTTKENIDYYVNNKRRFANWILAWPFSVIAYIFRDLFQNLTDMIVGMFSNVYRKIAMRHFN